MYVYFHNKKSFANAKVKVNESLFTERATVTMSIEDKENPHYWRSFDSVASPQTKIAYFLPLSSPVLLNWRPAVQ